MLSSTYGSSGPDFSELASRAWQQYRPELGASGELSGAPSSGLSNPAIDALHMRKQAVLLQLAHTQDPRSSAEMHQHLAQLDARLADLQGIPRPNYGTPTPVAHPVGGGLLPSDPFSTSIGDSAGRTLAQRRTKPLIGDEVLQQILDANQRPIDRAAGASGGRGIAWNDPDARTNSEYVRLYQMSGQGDPKGEGSNAQANGSASNYGYAYQQNGRWVSGTPEEVHRAEANQKALNWHNPIERAKVLTGLDMLGLPSAFAGDVVKFVVGAGTNTLDKPEILNGLNKEAQVASYLIPGVGQVRGAMDAAGLVGDAMRDPLGTAKGMYSQFAVPFDSSASYGDRVLGGLSLASMLHGVSGGHGAPVVGSEPGSEFSSGIEKILHVAEIHDALSTLNRYRSGLAGTEEAGRAAATLEGHRLAMGGEHLLRDARASPSYDLDKGSANGRSVFASRIPTFGI